MELFPFQVTAATEISNKYITYAEEPLMVTRTKMVPFYQNLSSITGSGKTLILADAITQIRSQLSAEPIVLWLSKGKVVVWQTLNNLSIGKYADLVSEFVVKPLTECQQSDIEDPSSGLILVATVGKFNQRDKEEGDRKIYQVALDFGETSLWEMLKKRRDTKGKKRPFIVVYDEGHNLSNQQTETLLDDLEPDALIAASATMRIPDALSATISRLRQDKKWTDADFTTVVKSGEVVKSGLVKQHILLGGYVTPMEIAIDDMLENMRRVDSAAAKLGLPFKPKAIYVSDTNTVSGRGNTDNLQSPFIGRQARPILIWRHLVENCSVDPNSIAVYCNLKFDPKFPPPPSFHLFAGKDSDYDKFVTGDYQHIIFNLTLQEGWDDPSCYFAYIDKDMGSKVQVTQIIGRVLRQPQAQHYADPELNTAHFYIRTDEKNAFEEVLTEVRNKISAETPEISLTVFSGRKGDAHKLTLPPKKVRELPEILINSEHAIEPIRRIFDSIQDYRSDTVNTIGKGGRIQVLQTIGRAGEEREEWIEFEHSNRVTARWVFTREIQKTYSRAINLCDIEEIKFDALVEYSSPAAEHLRESARKVVDAYIEHSIIVSSFANPLEVPAIPVDPSNMTIFTSSLHEGYSGLNDFEFEFAQALDKTKRVWFRNPSRGLFEIPLLTSGGTKNFNPDFIVWVDKRIIAIDPKGDHLIKEDAGRKLFFVEQVGTGSEVVIRLVTQGTWTDKIDKTNKLGFTVWTLRNGKPHPAHANNVSEAIQLCLQ
ncbi:MAG: DEAD/DEAH box helicase family protein [Nitrospirales bacterium]